MENENNFAIETSEQIPPGFYFISDGEKIFYGSITDLGDNWIGSGLFKLFLEKEKGVVLIVSKNDWDKSPEMIFELE